MREIVALKLDTWITLAALGVVMCAGTYMVGRVHSSKQMTEMAALIRAEADLTESGFISRAVPMRVTVTGYAAVPELTDSTPHITALGLVTGRRICAADPAVIPMRSWVLIPDLGLCYVADSGSKVRGAHIDFLFDSKEEAREWGRKKRQVYVVKPIEGGTP